MIASSISDSFLYYGSPWNRMLRYLLNIGKIRCKIIIILIYYDDTHRLSGPIPIDTEKYSNMFLISCCKRIIRFSIKTSNQDLRILNFSSLSCLFGGSGLFHRLMMVNIHIKINGGMPGISY